MKVTDEMVEAAHRRAEIGFEMQQILEAALAAAPGTLPEDRVYPRRLWDVTVDGARFQIYARTYESAVLRGIDRLKLVGSYHAKIAAEREKGDNG